MASRYDHKNIEARIYKMWEEGGYFEADRDPAKKPYTIVLPPPNASGKMHMGNVLMIAIEDILIRWKRMQGYSALWLPGTDHAGFETPYILGRGEILEVSHITKATSSANNLYYIHFQKPDFRFTLICRSPLDSEFTAEDFNAVTSGILKLEVK